MAQDISKMNSKELKALAYDISMQIQALQRDLNVLQVRINELASKQPVKDAAKTDKETVE